MDLTNSASTGMHCCTCILSVKDITSISIMLMGGGGGGGGGSPLLSLTYSRCSETVELQA